MCCDNADRPETLHPKPSSLQPIKRSAQPIALVPPESPAPVSPCARPGLPSVALVSKEQTSERIGSRKGRGGAGDKQDGLMAC